MASQRDGGIAWCDETWNPIRGCSRVSEGCRNCYAERMAARFSRPGQPYHGFAKIVAPRDHMDRVGGRRNGWTGKVALVHERLTDPLHWRNPRRVFVNSMSDLFHEGVPDEWIDRIFAVMLLAPQHTFQILTKRPERMLGYLSNIYVTEGIESAACGLLREFPEREPKKKIWPLPNVWLGVSVEDQAAANERIPLLLQTPAVVRFVSAEPLLGPLDLGRYLGRRLPAPYPFLVPVDGPPPRGLDWVIVGGESGPGARPMSPDWARPLRDQCVSAMVPFFFKQWGEWGPGDPADYFPERCDRGHRFLNKTRVFRVGKRIAGRSIDGREWSEFPA